LKHSVVPEQSCAEKLHYHSCTKSSSSAQFDATRPQLPLRNYLSKHYHIIELKNA